MQRTAAPETLAPSTNFTAQDEPLPAVARDHQRGPTPPPESHRLRNAIILVLLAAALVFGYFRISANRKAAADKAAGPQRGGFSVPVVAGTAEQKDVPIYLDGLGTIQALNTVTVRARVDGQLEKLAINEGDEVKAGDLIAQLDAAPFQASLDQATARKKTDEVQLNNARADLERYQDLVQKKVISQQQFDTQKALVAQLEATVRNDQAAVTSAQVQFDYTHITSPIAGRSGIRQVDVGNIVPRDRSDRHRRHHAIAADLAALHAPGAEPGGDSAEADRWRIARRCCRVARQQDRPRRGKIDRDR